MPRRVDGRAPDGSGDPPPHRAAVSLSTTRLALEGGQLARLPFAPPQALAGAASVQLDASALGDSPAAALVSALAGTGRVELRDGAVLGLQPAFSTV